MTSHPSLFCVPQDLQPLVLTFDLPVTLVSQALPDAASPVIQQVAQALGVSVSFRAQPRLYSSCCVVRALQGNSVAIKVSGTQMY
jgi:hypothetical protein